MRQVQMNLLIVSAIFLSGASSCQSTMPKAPVVQRCILFLEENMEICNSYVIDEMGGHTIPDTEVRRPISNRSVTFPIEEWTKISTWRDEIIEWSQDLKCK
jgi:hypothetical protein